MKERYHRARRGRASVSGVDPRDAQVETPFGYRTSPRDGSQFMKYVDSVVKETQAAMQRGVPTVGRVFYDVKSGHTVYEVRSTNKGNG